AKATSEAQEVESLKATLVSRSLEVDDCILRAPFAGEVSERFADPGAYLRPGNAVATVIDRSVVRITADAPEADFAVVAPETPVAIEIEATGVKLMGKVSRRAPAADEATRTVHFEIDVPNEVRPKSASRKPPRWCRCAPPPFAPTRRVCSPSKTAWPGGASCRSSASAPASSI